MIILIGDIHGDFNALVEKLATTPVMNSYFIQVGDFGVGFKVKEREAMELQSVNNELRKKNNVMYVIRGNHDDPGYFNNELSYSNLHLLKDYSVLLLEGSTILLAGGAISIDRRRRVLNDSYWSDEAFVFNVQSLQKTIRGLTQMDLVVTHNAPEEFQPTELNQLVLEFNKKDTRLIIDLNKERRLHSKLMKALISAKLKPRFWYYGHYHFSHQGDFDEIKYKILDSMESFEHRNTI